MNKFYQNYKDLFLSSQGTTFTNYLRDRHYRADTGKNYNQKHQNERNQLHRIFNQSQSNSRLNQVLQEKWQLYKLIKLKQVVLPKLQNYDRQIESKLKRFKTQEKYLSNNSYLRENLNSLSLKSAGKPSDKQPQLSIFMNPQYYSSQESQDFVSLETEYQRCYSKKKIKLLRKPYNSVIEILDQQNKVPNFHSENDSKLSKLTLQYQKNEAKDLNVQLQIQSFIKQKPFNSKRKEIRFKVLHDTKRQTEYESKDTDIHQPRKKQNSLRLALRREEGIKFSQYQNQFEFINKRLEHIHQFNNYYSHKCINSYKKAIARRIDFKKRLSTRQNQLKYLLKTDRQD